MDELKFPLYLRPDIYGVEMSTRDARSVKNIGVRDILGGLPPMRGYVVVGNPRTPDAVLLTQEVLASESVPFKFKFWAYDAITANPMPFADRLELLRHYVGASGSCVGLTAYKRVNNVTEYKEFEAQQILAGFKGVAHGPED